LHCNARLRSRASAAEEEPILAEEVHTGISVEPLAKSGSSAKGVKCPDCGAKLAEHAVLCVQCGYDFRLGRSRANVPTPAPRRLRRRAFKQVLIGLTLYSARVLLSLLATLLIFGLNAYLAANRQMPAHEPPLWLALGLLGGIGLWLMSICCGFAGSILCLWVPASSRGRWPLALALFLDVLSVPLGVLAALLPWTTLLSWAAGLCSWALFLVFLIRLAVFIDRPSEAHEGRSLLLHGLILIAAMFILGSAMALARDPFALGIVVTVLLPIFAGAYWRMQYTMLKLIESLRASIRQQLDEAQRHRELAP
jgi:hypothetical protein